MVVNLELDRPKGKENDATKAIFTQSIKYLNFVVFCDWRFNWNFKGSLYKVLRLFVDLINIHTFSVRVLTSAVFIINMEH